MTVGGLDHQVEGPGGDQSLDAVQRRGGDRPGVAADRQHLLTGVEDEGGGYGCGLGRHQVGRAPCGAV